MSLAITYSRALAGLHAELVTVEVHLANGLPAFNLVGLPDVEVRESRDRVRAAIQTAGFEFPARKLTVNLAPADFPKESGRFDLPIAIGILVASGQLPSERLRGLEFAGELGLNGDLRAVRGALAMALAASRDGHTLILPTSSCGEAARVSQASVLGASTLLQVAAHIAERDALVAPVAGPAAQIAEVADLLDVKGQTQAKRALEIAAAGRHSLLMIGPPGTGKSMLAQRLPGILPPMSEQEAVDSAALLSLVGKFNPAAFGQRPIRAPHHTASAVALVGGGSDPRPGEISLAHHGVLFLDEIVEFDRRVLEVLREPLETHAINISRAARQVTFPANFQLIAAMNPWRLFAFLPHLRVRLKVVRNLAFSRNPQTVGEHLRKKRIELGLRQIDVAERIGVAEWTIINWERGTTTKVPDRYFAKVIEFLGYNPEPEPSTWGARLKWKRRLLGLTATAFGKMIGVSVDTIQAWERGQMPPTFVVHREAVAGFLAT
ncbi:MAG: YifB family Mg chelatase-like AAA ATPase [Burkholderiales bacterium]|nr:YifB family Mg chelatase-like AAA ATPase [Burkholderiales bacterium]